MRRKLFTIAAAVSAVAIGLAFVVGRYRDRSSEVATYRALMVLSSAMYHLGWDDPEVNRGSWEELVRHIESDERTTHLLDPYPMIRMNTDPWGSHFVIERSPADRLIRIRSLGRNKRDDHGSADDLEVRLPM
jgi:hypothetical protein